MRRLLALILSATLPFVCAAAEAKPKASPKPAAAATPAPAVAAAKARLKALEKAQLTPAYGDAQLALATAYRANGQLAPALAAAQAAAAAFDQQVELHKSLSEVVMTYELARSERAAARQAGLKRDEAFFLVGGLARALGNPDLAIRHYAMVVQSQPDQPLGAKALAELTALGFVALPASPSPSPSKAP